MNCQALETMITLNLVDKDVSGDKLRVLLELQKLAKEGVNAVVLQDIWNEFINSDRHITGRDQDRS